MAYYLNGIVTGLGSLPTSEYPNATIAKWHFMRLIYLWLTKIVGWTLVDSSGTKWELAVVSATTDGATDTVNPSKFSSALATFLTAGVRPGDVLVLYAGLTDSSRHGFYHIHGVDQHTLYVDTWRGVHSDGLPLGESGLSFCIYRFNDASDCPANTDFFVVRGTGIGGQFDARCVINTGTGYSQWDVSPFADWDVATHAWATARRTAQVNYTPCSSIASYEVPAYGAFGVGALDHFTIISGSSEAIDDTILYIGDIVAQHPASDLRPVVFLTTTIVNYFGIDKVRMLTYNDTPTTASLRNVARALKLPNPPCAQGVGPEQELFLLPFLIYKTTAGYVEQRGFLKDVYGAYGALGWWQYHAALGPSLRYLRVTEFDYLSGMNLDLILDWNGSLATPAAVTGVSEHEMAEM